MRVKENGKSAGQGGAERAGINSAGEQKGLRGKQSGAAQRPRPHRFEFVFAAACGLQQRVAALKERKELVDVKLVVEAPFAGNPELLVCKRGLPVQEVGLGLVQHYLPTGDGCR